MSLKSFWWNKQATFGDCISKVNIACVSDQGVTWASQSEIGLAEIGLAPVVSREVAA